jgi:cytochrome d ubiquinol oxidase subunit I
MAAAEALWTTEQPASFSLFTIGSLDGSKEVFSIKVPYVLSFLATGSFDGKVLGINDLVSEAKNGNIVGATTALQTAPEVKANVKAASSLDGFPGWVPNLPVTYWSFRLMMGLGFLAFLLGAWVLFATRKGATPKGGKLWTAAMIAAPLAPLFGNSFGWIFTEMGRQPFIVFGVLPTMSANSPGVTAPEVAITMVLYTAIYGVLAVVEVGLLLHFIKLGLPEVKEPEVLVDDDAPLSFAY